MTDRWHTVQYSVGRVQIKTVKTLMTVIPVGTWTVYLVCFLTGKKHRKIQFRICSWESTTFY